MSVAAAGLGGKGLADMVYALNRCHINQTLDTVKQGLHTTIARRRRVV
jgi:hypothetical protein